MRNPAIDILKGILIFLVITGHLVPGDISTNFARFFIYSFHMPLFIGISGYLLSYQKLENISLIKLAGKYLTRVIIPWLIAALAYMIMINYRNITGSVFFKYLAGAFLFPSYHLWYIPAFLSWVFISWLGAKLKVKPMQLLIFSVLLSGTFIFLDLNSSRMQGIHYVSAILLNTLNTLRPQYFIYFAIGVFLRSKEKVPPPFITGFFSLLFLTGLSVCFFMHLSGRLSAETYPLITYYGIYLLNLFFIPFVISFARKTLSRKLLLFEWTGINSLGIYLWHMVPLIVVKAAIGTGDLPKFYLYAVGAEIIFLVFYRFLSRAAFINKWFFGIA